MFRLKYPTEQSDPPLSPRETLPTMYDLPSEDPEESGVDQFHDFQPELLWLTFQPVNYRSDYRSDRVFSASDLNLYYDVHHQNWYKRPDWFGVVGVPRLYDGHDLRLSYVIWQEGVSPSLIVELLSPSTEKEDLGENRPEYDNSNNGYGDDINGYADKPPSKWEVYERILRVPYYVVYSPYTDQLRVFVLRGDRYERLILTEPRVWLKELGIGLGLWDGEYKGIHRLWLRFYDADGNWILTDTESASKLAEMEGQRAEYLEQRVENAEQRAEAAEQRAKYLEQRLKELGINP